MSVSERIVQMAKENNGIVTAAMVVAAGYSRGNLRALADKGMLEAASRGFYVLPDIIPDTFAALQSRFKRGIFSHETALFLHDLTDRTPNYYCMTFPSRYNISEPKKVKVRCTQVVESWYGIGIETVHSPAGSLINVYGKERTICDILRPLHGVAAEVTGEAVKRYVKSKDRNLPKLSQYAKLFKVEDKVRSYLEVLI